MKILTATGKGMAYLAFGLFIGAVLLYAGIY
jgi:hypothetical protein